MPSTIYKKVLISLTDPYVEEEVRIGQDKYISFIIYIIFNILVNNSNNDNNNRNHLRNSIELK